jgi:hypothetical protein
VTTPIEPRWYCVDANGLATRCVDQSDAQRVAIDANYMFPRSGPHRAVLLGDVAAERETIQRLRTVAEQVLADIRAQGVLMEWETMLAEALAGKPNHSPDVTKKV